MCGIAGVIGVAGITEAHVRGMISSIRHRGMDESGVKALPGAVMGHTRLTIVDAEHGQQPMPSDDGKVWISFNGEIYNFIELRAELEVKGYRFRTNSDTEVLLYLWREEGEAMLSRLIGMFAFFLWDASQQKGILARDRQGIKPCFIMDYKGGIAFASEMKALFALPDVARTVNPEGLKNVFTFNYCPPQQTCFLGVSHLEPGCYLSFSTTKNPEKKRYWVWPYYDEKYTPDFDEFEALIDDAVRIQMRFDVKGGMYLSGGVDSSIVAYHLRKSWKGHAFSAYGLSFPNQEYSEFAHSRRVADLLGIGLDEICVTPEMIPGIADKVSYHAEQPHGDFSFFLFYLLAQHSHADGRKVMFSGDGPDESMAGQHFQSQPPADFAMSDYFNTICYMDETVRRRVLNSDFERSTKDPYVTFNEMMAPYEKLEPIERIGAYESSSLLPGNNILKGERMASAFSLEIRSPLLDHRISELFVRLPVTQKFSEGFSKYYLKKYAATKLPRDHIFKRKSMPTLPIGEWMKSVLYDWAISTLERIDGAYINKQAALELLAEHKSGVYNHTRPLRTIIMTQLWMEQSAKLGSHARAA